MGFLSLHQNAVSSVIFQKTAFSLNKTVDQHLGANSEYQFLLNFTPNLLLFGCFSVFCTKSAENDYFNQRLGCAALKHWYKYTAHVHCLT